MTMREVHTALKYINLRTHNSYVGQAALHGIKLPPMSLLGSPTKNTSFEPDLDKFATNHMQSLLKNRKMVNKGNSKGGRR